MKLSISNIGWKQPQDQQVYELMKKYGFCGLEIAPTRICPENPYDHLETIKEWKKTLKETYGFEVPSMQSIWFGRTENMFRSEDERKTLLNYTKKAIDFASVIGCKNLVFGCPRNRNLPEGADKKIAIEFFKELGAYAAEKKTVIGMEANPPIYNTNYINDTRSALELVREVASEGFLLNLDVGTMIQNEETLEELQGQVPLFNHVHISEPGLKMIEERSLHTELAQLLKKENYKKYVSIEMGAQEDWHVIEKCMAYVSHMF